MLLYLNAYNINFFLDWTALDGVDLSESILQLHQLVEELRNQIRDLRDRVVFLEQKGGDSTGQAGVFLELPSPPQVAPTTTTTTTTSRPAVSQLWLFLYISFCDFIDENVW